MVNLEKPSSATATADHLHLTILIKESKINDPFGWRPYCVRRPSMLVCSVLVFAQSKTIEIEAIYGHQISYTSISLQTL